MTLYQMMSYFSGLMVGLLIGYGIRKKQDPRKIVMVFARMMEAKMHLRDDRGDWRDGNALMRLCNEFDELLEADVDLEIVNESVDVAITSMQFADEIAPLCDHDGRGRSIGILRRALAAPGAR